MLKNKGHHSEQLGFPYSRPERKIRRNAWRIYVLVTHVTTASQFAANIA